MIRFLFDLVRFFFEYLLFPLGLIWFVVTASEKLNLTLPELADLIRLALR